MIISPYHVTISPCRSIISPYHTFISPYHTIIVLDHMIISNPTDTRRLFKPLPGLHGPPMGTYLAPSPESTHKITKKTPRIIKKMSPVKDDRKSSSEKLRRVAGYLFYTRGPPDTSLKVTVSMKLSQTRKLQRKMCLTQGSSIIFHRLR